jgi:outer membrane protein OmpA-like peptidoglycan-associated protein
MRVLFRVPTPGGCGALLTLVVSASIALSSSIANAEPLGHHVDLTPYAGYSIFDPDTRVNGARLVDHYAFGGRLGFRARPWLGFEATGTMIPTRARGGDDVTYLHGSAGAMISPFADRFGGPFLYVGGGAARLRDSGGATVDQGSAELATGFQIWMSNVVGLRLEAREVAWLPNGDSRRPRNQTVLVGAGLTFAVGGRPHDSDGDGVLDRDDRCPDTPRGLRVDAHGCPEDSDHDGVPDGIDRCPDTRPGAVVDALGCAKDSDHDGVPDGIDRCPDTVRGAAVDSLGCPKDSDQDGVWDGIDKCPDTPRRAVVDATGCPKDSDQDGVPDGIDRCPDTPAHYPVDSTGCSPQIDEFERGLVRDGMIQLIDLPFETGKAKLLPAATHKLDAVGRVLVQWADLRWEIGGHTEAQGSRLDKKQLSEARAIAVLYYLLKAYPALNRDAFTIRGYGGSKPIATGKDPASLARNRRIEFKVLNPDVLQREIKHRGLLQGTSDPNAPKEKP